MTNGISTDLAIDGRLNGMRLQVGGSAVSGAVGHAERPRRFKIRCAESEADRQSASILVDRMYATRGYQTSAQAEVHPKSRKTFLASDQYVAVGTMSIGLDSDQGLMADQLFPLEVSQFRSTSEGVCEFTKLAMDRRARSPRLLASLFHVAFLYAYRTCGVRYLLIEVNPRHVRYYQQMLNFEVIGEPRHNSRVNAPAVLLVLDLAVAEVQIQKFGGNALHSATERSAYPYFFDPSEEASIVRRISMPDADLVDVFDYESVLKPVPLTEAATH